MENELSEVSKLSEVSMVNEEQTKRYPFEIRGQSEDSSEYPVASSENPTQNSKVKTQNYNSNVKTTNGSGYPVASTQGKTKKYPFEIRGKISCTPEQAERMFGFKMKEGATGIVFTKRPSGKIVIRNKMPQQVCRATPQKNKETIFSIVGRIASEHLKDIVRPIWNEKGEEMDMSGQNLFIRENMKVLETVMKKQKLTHKKKINVMTVTEWEKLKVSTGKLPKPIIKIAEYYFSTGKRLKLIIKNPNKYDVGVCLLDRESFELTHIPPRSYEYPMYIHLEKTVHRPAVYIYFADGGEYSESSGVIPKSVKG